MHTREAATESVLRHLRSVERGLNEFGSALLGTDEREQTALVITHVDEHDFGWVFFYNSKAYADTGNYLYALGGNGPVIVSRADGKLYATGTAAKVEFYIGEFRQGRLTPLLP